MKLNLIIEDNKTDDLKYVLAMYQFEDTELPNVINLLKPIPFVLGVEEEDQFYWFAERIKLTEYNNLYPGEFEDYYIDHLIARDYENMFRIKGCHALVEMESDHTIAELLDRKIGPKPKVRNIKP